MSILAASMPSRESREAVERAHEYAFSGRKRALSYAVAGLVLPINVYARTHTKLGLLNTGYPVRFTQERVGRLVEGQLTTFDIFKLRTLYVEDGQDVLVGSGAQQRRRNRLDETEQWFNILRGDMLAFGHRPLQIGEREEFMDSLDIRQQARYQQIVEPTYTGLFSSVSIDGVRGNSAVHDPATRCEMNIEDVMRGSIGYDIGLLKAFLDVLSSGRLVDLRLEATVTPTE